MPNRKRRGGARQDHPDLNQRMMRIQELEHQIDYLGPIVEDLRMQLEVIDAEVRRTARLTPTGWLIYPAVDPRYFRQLVLQHRALTNGRNRLVVRLNALIDEHQALL